MMSSAQLSPRAQAPTLRPASGASPVQEGTAALQQEAARLRQQLVGGTQAIENLTRRLKGTAKSNSPDNVAAHQAMHAFLRARAGAQLALAGNQAGQAVSALDIASLPLPVQELVRLHDERELQLALFRRNEIDLFFVEEQMELTEPQAVLPAGQAAPATLTATSTSTSSDPAHEDSLAGQGQQRPEVAHGQLAALKARQRELESARAVWQKAITVLSSRRTLDVQVASAFTKRSLMGGIEVSASGIWQWMDKLPGFTDLTPNQQHAVKVMAAFKVEDGSCWKLSVQIEAHVAGLITQPALRLKQREALLKKVKPVQLACSDLYMRATRAHPQELDLIRSLQEAWTVRRHFATVLIRQIRADRKALGQFAGASQDSSAATRGEDSGSASTQRLQDLLAAHERACRIFSGAMDRLDQATRSLTDEQQASLDSFAVAVVAASRTDPDVWESIERIPGFEALTVPVKKAAQLSAQLKVCNMAALNLADEIASLLPASVADSDVKLSS
ncbi:MAG: hypothetical protein H7332_05405 [Bdellovibrionales bacterium]|nr:hypothetical protein [Ramlibacter sp.]